MKIIPVPQKRRNIRAIDEGTIYDVTGKMRAMVREMERGEEGTITDAVIIIRRNNGSIGTRHFGPGGREIAHWMVSTAKGRLEPQ